MKRMLFAATMAVMGGFAFASGPAQAVELSPADTGGVIKTGGDFQRADWDDYCYRHPYRCRERWREDRDRRYRDDDWRERRWRWREWEDRRAWWWRHEGRRDFCWRHPDHWRCYRDHH